MGFYRESYIKESTDDMKAGLTATAGVFTGNVVGRQVENIFFKQPVTASDSAGKKIGAYLVNSITKFGLAHATKKYAPGSEMTKRDAMLGVLVAWGEDTILRLANKGVNPADIMIGGYRVMGRDTPDSATFSKAIQENSVLRGELNKAMQKLAQLAAAGIVPGKTNDQPNIRGDIQYGGAPSPAVIARQRNYGAMPWTPDVAEREKHFGSMPFVQNPQKNARERKYGMMSYPTENATLAAFGMV